MHSETHMGKKFMITSFFLKLVNLEFKIIFRIYESLLNLFSGKNMRAYISIDVYLEEIFPEDEKKTP